MYYYIGELEEVNKGAIAPLKKKNV